MALIKSISGIRGTIGGRCGDNLTPADIMELTTAFSILIKEQTKKEKLMMVVGRDARVSGQMVSTLVCGTLQSMGVDVIDTGLSTTPTTEMAVTQYGANGGIIITASHNPMQWNALKLLNAKGEFISAAEGRHLLELAAQLDHVDYADISHLGKYQKVDDTIQHHIDAILALPLVNRDAIAKANFRVVLDTINSTGALALPPLLEQLGVTDVTVLNGEANGIFAHTPEPIPENLTGIAGVMRQEGRFDVGFVVDPDVDRLAILQEDGTMFGEEYTLVAVADYILKHEKGNTVSNLSSSRALRDVSGWHGVSYSAAAVGEVNVVEKMKETNAIIGGEGNGGVIYPALHYGRDALVGIALFLSHLAAEKCKCSELRRRYPDYHISKNKIELDPTMSVPSILDAVAQHYANESVSRIDGVKIDFAKSWAHIRSSNTEPIIRIYTEAATEAEAEALASEIMTFIKKITQ